MIVQEATARDLTSKKALFSLPPGHEVDIWIVLRVEKVLQGDPDVVREPYSKVDQVRGQLVARVGDVVRALKLL